MSQPSEISKFQKGYYISTYLIAVIAIIGFVFSTYNSYQNSKQIIEVSKTLSGFERNIRKLERNISLINEPLLKFVGAQWRLKDSSKELSCNNAPVAIRLAYQNVSKVPLVIENTSLVIKYGKLPLPVTSEAKFNEMILVPGEQFHWTYSGQDLTQATSVSKGSDTDPLLSIESDIGFSDIERSKKYKYIAIHKIPFSCSERVAEYKFAFYGFSAFRAVKEECTRMP